MKTHIIQTMAAQRRMQGLTQQRLGEMAGVRREKLNRVEVRDDDIGLADLCRLLDALGLQLGVFRKANAGAGADPSLASAAPPPPPPAMP